jgi:hypothetical protein
MAWCVPDEALRRRRVPSILEMARLMGEVQRIHATDERVTLRYSFGRITVPGPWTVGREA